MKFFLGALLFFGIGISSSSAQRVCGTVNYNQQLIIDNPSLQESFAKAQQQISAFARPANNAAKDTTLNQVITVPVVIHLLYNTEDQDISDAQVLSQLTVLNQDYRRQNADAASTPDAFKPFAADAKIMFCLAQVDPQGKRTTGIIRKYTSQNAFITNDAMKYSAQGGDDAWDCTKYLNIWVCSLLGRSLGYAALPGGPADRDGVVITYDAFGTTGNVVAPFDKGRTATHEIGHWLGLRHLWGDAYCGDDSIADTPQQESYNYGCPAFPHLSSCSPNANGDMYMDFMDFSDDGCMNMFTTDQVKVMRSLFAKGNIRNSFLNAYQCDSTEAEGGPLPVSTTTTSTDSVTAQVIKVYPNPAHAQLIIETTNTVSKAAPETVRIFNTLGIQVFTAQLLQSKATINISSLPAGVYIVHVENGSTIFTLKIIHE